MHRFPKGVRYRLFGNGTTNTMDAAKTVQIRTTGLFLALALAVFGAAAFAASVLPLAPQTALAATCTNTAGAGTLYDPKVTISATPCTATVGTPVTLQWSTSGGTGPYVAYSSFGATTVNGSMTVYPTANTSYNLEVDNNAYCDPAMCTNESVGVAVTVTPVTPIPPTPTPELHVSYGRIDASGNIVRGSGDFTVTHQGSGLYVIHFNAGIFSDYPSVVLDADYIGTCGSYGNMAFRAELNSINTSGGAYNAFLETGARECYSDVPFSFIAVGRSSVPNTGALSVAFGVVNSGGAPNATAGTSGNWNSYLVTGDTYVVNFNNGTFSGTPIVIAGNQGAVDCTALMSTSITGATFTERHSNCTDVNATQPFPFVAIGGAGSSPSLLSNWNISAARFAGGTATLLPGYTGGLSATYDGTNKIFTVNYPTGWFVKAPPTLAVNAVTRDQTQQYARPDYCADAMSMYAGYATIGLTGDGTTPNLCTYSEHTIDTGINVIAVGPSNNPPPSAAISCNGLTGSCTLANYGDTAQIAWTSTSTVSCSGTGTSGSNATSGVWTTLPLTTSTAYAATCIGPGGSTTVSVTVNVPPPTGTITVESVDEVTGAPVNAEWWFSPPISSATGPICTSTGPCTGTSAVYAGQLTGTYTIYAVPGSAGSNYSMKAEPVRYARKPTAPLDRILSFVDEIFSPRAEAVSYNRQSQTLTPNATIDFVIAWSPIIPTASVTCNGVSGSCSIPVGGTADIVWSSTNTVSCSGTGTNGSTAASGGPWTTPPLPQTTSYTVTCTGVDNLSATATVTVTVGSGDLREINPQ